MRNVNRWKLKAAVAGVLTAIAATSFAGQMTLYPRPGFQGRGFTTTDTLADVRALPPGDAGMSIVVNDGTWEACTEAYFRGRCTSLVPGNYSNLSASLGGMVASVRQIAVDPAPARVVVYPDGQQVPVGTASAPVVINPGASVVISAAPSAPLVVSTTDPRQVVLSPDTIPVPAGPRIILYQNTPKGMRAVELTSNVDDLGSRNFSNSAYAAFVSDGTWRLCDQERGRGRCSDFAPGRYESLGGLEGRVRSAYLIASTPERVATVATVPAFPPGRAVLYQFPNFTGPQAVVEFGRAPDLDWAHFKQPASSLRVESGTWLVCSEMGYQGECRVLGPGEYPQLTNVLNGGVYSARQVWRPEYGSVTRYYVR
jgi:hypothetical protein